MSNKKYKLTQSEINNIDILKRRKRKKINQGRVRKMSNKELSERLRVNIQEKKEEYRANLEENFGVLMNGESMILEAIKNNRNFGIVRRDADLVDEIFHSDGVYTFVRGMLSDNHNGDLSDKVEDDVAIFDESKGRLMQLAEKYGYENIMYFTGGHFELKRGKKTILKESLKHDGIGELKNLMREYYNSVSQIEGDNLVLQERKRLNHLQYYVLRPFWFDIVDESI